MLRTVIDDDGDGCIQASEILKMMNKLDKEIDSDLFWGTFNKLDTDHSAKLCAETPATHSGEWRSRLLAAAGSTRSSWKR